MDITKFLLQVALLAPPILLALTVHEASHAAVAYWRGDPTAKWLGRMTLNPLKHLDLMGTIAFFVTALAGSGIGWAKPVPVDSRNLKNPRVDHMLISGAGPVANLATAALLAVLFNLLIYQLGFFSGPVTMSKQYLVFFFEKAIFVNVILACFNLIPLPPLDGSGVLAGLLPRRAAITYLEIGRYGFFIILALIFLPNFLPGFPDIIRIFVVGPASFITGLLLPWWN